MKWGSEVKLQGSIFETPMSHMGQNPDLEAASRHVRSSPKTRVASGAPPCRMHYIFCTDRIRILREVSCARQIKTWIFAA